LKPAIDAVESDDAFKKEVEQLLGGKPDFEIRRTKEEIQKQIETLTLSELQEKVDGGLGDAVKAHSKWLMKREKGAKKVGSSLQRFVTCFSDFLDAYSGIVDIVKNAGFPYSNVAYGTLSLFITVRASPP
jgi:hypothetical protein